MEQRKDFDMKKAFQLFLSRSNQDYIDATEIQQILFAHGMLTFEGELQTLFGRVDKDKDGLVGFADFKRELSPIKYREMRKLLK